MKKTQIIPGLSVDGTMFDAAAAGIRQYVPHLDLTWATFTDPHMWLLVPDDRGDGYKAELVLQRTADRTVKVNVWFLPDLRGGNQSKPHSHPWAFDAYVLLGGYDEDRYVPDGGMPRREQVEHSAGGVNTVPLTTYHEVTEIHDPGRTVTLMVCGPGQQGAWGYLDVATGEHLPVEPDPLFGARMRALNPQRA